MKVPTIVIREREDAISQGAPWSVPDAEYELVVTVEGEFVYYTFSWPFEHMSDLPTALERMADYLRGQFTVKK